MAEPRQTLADFDFGRVDLTNCDREPIHVPSAIQSHGFLFVLDPDTLAIRQLSTNVASIVGCDPDALLGGSVAAFLDEPCLDVLARAAAAEDIEVVNPLRLKLRGDIVRSFWDARRASTTSALSMRENLLGEVRFDGVLHRTDAGLVLELEFAEPASEGDYSINHHLRKALDRLSKTDSLERLAEAAVQEIRHLTGFDRVKLYRFNAAWNGEVIAEARAEHMPAYLGLHFPATDIPAQARTLYVLNRVRLIPRIGYTPVPLYPQENPKTGATLDMSHCALRSVSPIHLEYLGNMGIGASFSVSILRDGKLWGLIACHHSEPLALSYEIRMACAFLGQVIGMQLELKQDQSMVAYEARYRSVIARIVEQMVQSDDLVHALYAQEPTILDLIDADGAVVCYDGQIFSLGTTPPEGFVTRLLTWLRDQRGDFSLFFTTNLAAHYEEARGLTSIASGLLGVSVTGSWQNAILWFRPEVRQTVAWGGNPEKAVTADDDGEMRLSPRKSFDAWTEQVRGHSLPWVSADAEAAAELRRAVIDIALRRAEELAELNRELRRSNDELDSFSYIASHDLKEPLRGIQNYSRFLMEDYGSVIGEEGIRQLETIGKLSVRLDGFITALLQYSRVGRVDMSYEKTDLSVVVNGVTEILQPSISERGAQVEIVTPLPTLWCDRVRIGEVFSNLITNGPKYNTSEIPQIEIGCYLPTELGQAPESVREKADERHHTFFVRDNGIGIRERHQEAIFRIFKRLHGRDKYGGGTGAGLTIVQRIIERHDGKIWVESAPGEGSTFFFTLVTEKIETE